MASRNRRRSHRSSAAHAVGPILWLRENLFSSWAQHGADAAGAVAHLRDRHGRDRLGRSCTPPGTAPDGSDCSREHAGACWPFAAAWFGQFMYGRYPDAERWRVNLTYALALAGLVPLMIPRVPGKLWSSIYLLAVFPVLAFILLSGGVFGLAPHPDRPVGRAAGDAGDLQRRASPPRSPSASCWRWGGARACRSCAGCRSASSSSCAACR